MGHALMAHHPNMPIQVKPSAMREIIIDVPHVKWTDIGGQHETKQQLR